MSVSTRLAKFFDSQSWSTASAEVRSQSKTTESLGRNVKNLNFKLSFFKRLLVEAMRPTTFCAEGALTFEKIEA